MALQFGNPFAARSRRSYKIGDTGLRMLALLLAIGLWVFVNAGERGSVEQLTVPISYRTLPADMVIMNHPPDFVKIEVSGPRTLLSLLDEQRLALKLDLSGVTPGTSEYRLYPSMFNVPRQTTVTRIAPELVTLDIDRVVSRDLPLHLAIDGKVAQGYTISSVEVTPSSVVVRGPSRYVGQLTQVGTEPFDVKGLTSDVERGVEITPPGEGLRLSTAHAQARVAVTEVIADREFRGVDVRVKDPDYKYRLEPKQATLTIRGPAARLAGLDAKGMAYVDAKGVAPGAHDLPLQVSLPDGMQLVRQSPEKVRLRMSRERRSTDEHPS
jgi:YbbR domain-containing protein